MSEQEKLKACLDEAVKYARFHKNCISERKFDEIFAEIGLVESQKELVAAFLKEKNVIIGEKNEEAIDENYDLDGEEHRAIDFFYEELSSLKKYSDEERHALVESLIAGDESVVAELTNAYLPDVVQMARLYDNQGVAMEDLIGEGNIALVMALQTMACVENIAEADGYIGKFIIEAMEALVSDEEADEKLIIKMSKSLKKDDKLSENNISENPDRSSESGFDIFNGDELLKEAFEALQEDESASSGDGI